jgi:hypothetical protein
VAKSKTKWPVIAAVMFAVAVLVAVMYSTMGNAQVHCEVCVTFNGRTQCGNSASTSREQAERAATDLACNGLTAGMTELMQCQNSPTRKISFR